ncbi:hypothetical protein Hanom_Chr09g00862671 [Helianthus anomalus]
MLKSTLFISSQLTNISNSQPHVPCILSSSKRHRKSKPTRFAGSNSYAKGQSVSEY